jgi:hypothetical protein
VAGRAEENGVTQEETYSHTFRCTRGHINTCTGLPEDEAWDHMQETGCGEPRCVALLIPSDMQIEIIR